ncbi:hypothetical protein EJB05_01769, partial [Eragrostis curvula]
MPCNDEFVRTIQSDLPAGDLLEMLSSPFRKVSQVPKGRGRKPKMEDKDEDSVEEGRSYPSLVNWYKDEDSVEEGRAYPSLRNWYKDGDSDEEGWVSPSHFNWYKD